MISAPRSFVPVLMMVLVACGGDDGELTVDELPDAYASAVCKRSFDCCTTAELTDNTMTSCQNNTSFALALAVTSIRTSEAKGRARYQPAEARACVEALRGMPCDDWKDPRKREQLSGACKQMVLPLTDDGKPCGNDADCKSRHCEGEVPAMPNMPARDGVCTALSPAGASCTGHDTCAEGLHCDIRSLKCQPPLADGASCGEDRECSGGFCTEQGMCTGQIPVGKCYGGCVVAGESYRGNGLVAALLLALAVLAARLRVGLSARSPARRPRPGPRDRRWPPR